MRTIKTVILAILTATLFFSCDNDTDPTNNVCEDNYVSTLITDAFSLANGYTAITGSDSEIHEYKIQINATGEICSIGYQNPEANGSWLGYTGNYTMEVINNTSGASYSGLHSFSQTALEYQSITPVTVTSGDIITVRRVTDPGSSGVGSSGYEATRGRLLNNYTGMSSTPIPYPITQGNVVFLSSTFYYEGNPNPETYSHPYIALGFKVN